MEHLIATLGADPEIKIPRALDEDVYSQAIEIHNGKVQYGENDYSFRKFLQFPELHGWRVDSDYRIDYDKTAPQVAESQLADRLARLLQTWLFFGLIYTLVQDERGAILNFDQLSSHVGESPRVSTRELEAALETARGRVVAMRNENHDEARLYMVQIEDVLQHAKMVVRKNCGQNPNNLVRYGLNRQRPQDFVSDELALSLMVLGERLASWKARLMQETDTFIRGWHNQEEDEGWGPPRYVFYRMNNGGWCRRTVRTLQRQLRSNATLLLAAYLSDTNLDKGGLSKSHTCKGDDCDLDVSQNYTTGHTQPGDHPCGTVGPDMTTVLDILTKTDHLSAVPLLVIKRNEVCIKGGSTESYTLEVMDLSKVEPGEHFAAISHVWSDGWGNEEDNWIHHCQMDLIFQTLRKAATMADISCHDKNKSIPFWMDTLIIPVMTKEEEYNSVLKNRGINLRDVNVRSLRTKAIGQIGTVYGKCDFTIVLDNRLCSTRFDSSLHYQSMAILTSNWMKRLWTLQEAALSTQIFIVFQSTEREDDGLLNLDEVMRRLSESPVASSGCKVFADITRNHLADSIMHSLRPCSGATKDGFTMAVDSWKAARWRVSLLDRLYLSHTCLVQAV